MQDFLGASKQAVQYKTNQKEQHDINCKNSKYEKSKKAKGGRGSKEDSDTLNRTLRHDQ